MTTSLSSERKSTGNCEFSIIYVKPKHKPSRICAICDGSRSIDKYWRGKFAHSACTEQVSNSEKILWARLDRMAYITLGAKYAIHSEVLKYAKKHFEGISLSYVFAYKREKELNDLYTRINLTKIRNRVVK